MGSNDSNTRSDSQPGGHMARIRSIKPEFWIDEKVVELSPWARLLFIGSWNFADDYGYIDDKPRRIKNQIFPDDEIDIDALLAELVAAELFVRYHSPVGPVLYVRNWERHQRVDKAGQRRFETGDLSTPVGVGTPREESGSPREESPPAQVALAPDLEGKGSGKDLEGKGEPSSPHGAGSPTKRARTSKTNSEPSRFAEFYDEVYPRKEGRKVAAQSFAQALVKVDADTLIAAAGHYRTYVRGRAQQHILQPATWLNQERWTDQINGSTATANGRDSPRDGRTVSTEDALKGWQPQHEIAS